MSKAPPQNSKVHGQRESAAVVGDVESLMGDKNDGHKPGREQDRGHTTLAYHQPKEFPLQFQRNVQERTHDERQPGANEQDQSGLRQADPDAGLDESAIFSG